MAGNARLEQELLVLRQKLQATRGSKASLNALAGGQAPDSLSYAGSASAVLESGKRLRVVIVFKGPLACNA